MRAFSGSVLEWCGRADAARLLPQQPPSGRAAAGRTQAAAAPAAAWRPGRIRLAAGQHPPVGGSSRLQENGCCDRVPNAYCDFHLLKTLRLTLQHRCGRVQASYTTLGSRPAPGTPSGKRSVGTRRAASMWDTLSEGTARAAQLAPSAVTAGAVGGSATRRVVGRVSPTTSGSSTPRDRACSSTIATRCTRATLQWFLGQASRSHLESIFNCCETGQMLSRRSFGRRNRISRFRELEMTFDYSSSPKQAKKSSFSQEIGVSRPRSLAHASRTMLTDAF